MIERSFDLRYALLALGIIALCLFMAAENAEAGPILLPGDTGGVACGTNYDLGTEDFVTGGGETADQPTWTIGCNLEFQVDKFKLYTEVETLEDVDPTDLSFTAGTLFPLGDRTRMAVEIEGSSGHEKGMFRFQSDFRVKTRVGVVF